MKRKAQSGLEYLVTYGWALILVATVVSVLVFVVASPAQGATFSSSDPTKLMIKGAVVDNGLATIKLQNITGGAIKNIEVSENPNYRECTISAESVPAGGEITIICKVIGEPTGSIDVSFTDQAGLSQGVEVSGGGPIPMSPGGETICDDLLDNDFDGDVDCADTDCAGKTGPDGQDCEPGGETLCSDTFDNDGDSLPDCDDPDCANDPNCLVQPIQYTLEEIWDGGPGMLCIMGHCNPLAGYDNDLINTQSNFDFTTGCGGGSCLDYRVSFVDGGFVGQEFRIMEASSSADCWGSSFGIYKPDQHSCARLEAFNAVGCVTIIDCINNMILPTPWHFEILDPA